MMKSFILAATSIAYILSIASIADAKIKTSDRNLTTRSNAIPEAELKAIRQMLTDRYKFANSPRESEIEVGTAPRSFWVVKSLKVIDYGNFYSKDYLSAKIQYVAEIATYTRTVSIDKSQKRKIVYFKDNTPINTTVGVMEIAKEPNVNNGKWRLVSEKTLSNSTESR